MMSRKATKEGLMTRNEQLRRLPERPTAQDVRSTAHGYQSYIQLNRSTTGEVSAEGQRTADRSGHAVDRPKWLTKGEEEENIQIWRSWQVLQPAVDSSTCTVDRPRFQLQHLAKFPPCSQNQSSDFSSVSGERSTVDAERSTVPGQKFPSVDSSRQSVDRSCSPPQHLAKFMMEAKKSAL